MEDGSDAELSMPLSLAADMDALLQQRLLNIAAASANDGGNQNGQGVPEEDFEAAWNQAAADLSPVVSEATGADSSEILQALGNNNADSSIALLSILHNRGDSFQQACAQAAAVELQKRRRERSLAKIVEDAARQGSLPADLSCKKVLRHLQRHLPLTEIMGHRYRVRSDQPRVEFEPEPASSKRSRSKSRESRSRPKDAASSGDDSDEVDEDGETSSEDDGYSSFGGSGAESTEDSYSEEDESSESDDESDGSSRKKKKSSHRKSNLVAAPPPDWCDGDPPKAGYYLETFTDIYSKFKSFTKKHRGTGLLFKNLIQDDLKDTVTMELGLKSSKAFKRLSDEELIRLIKENLGFAEDDYYVRKLELLKLQPFKDAGTMLKSFRRLTTPFLRIMREAKESGVHLRFTNVARIFRNQIQTSPALMRWFQAKRFKSFSEAVRHVSQQIHDRLAKQLEENHDDLICDGKVAGARSDFRGGKVESGQAQDRRPPPKKPNRDNHRPAGRNNAPRGSNPNSPRGDAARPQRSAKEEAEFQAAMQKERDLPLGMYHHPPGPFCKEKPCKAKICQGCNYHADAEGRGHVRPNCRCKEHADFVATGYFHDRHPGRTGALSLPRPSHGQTQHRPPPPAHLRSVSGNRRASRDGAASGDA